MGKTAKIIRTGDEQSVRLPEDFRFAGDEVRIRKEGRTIVLEPVEEDDGIWASRLSGAFDEDFGRSIEAGRLGPDHMPDSPRLD